MGKGTDTQTDGHVDSMTNSAQRAELVKTVNQINASFRSGVQNPKLIPHLKCIANIFKESS